MTLPTILRALFQKDERLKWDSSINDLEITSLPDNKMHIVKCNQNMQLKYLENLSLLEKRLKFTHIGNTVIYSSSVPDSLSPQSNSTNIFTYFYFSKTEDDRVKLEII